MKNNKMLVDKIENKNELKTEEKNQASSSEPCKPELISQTRNSLN